MQQSATKILKMNIILMFLLQFYVIVGSVIYEEKNFEDKEAWLRTANISSLLYLLYSANYNFS